jgi:uroporphyrin-III C-methyltransferase
MLFGRAQEEIDALRAADICVEVVPGITAAAGASAELGISLTRRGVSRSVVFATPRSAKGDATGNWVRGLAGAETIVLYMAATETTATARALIAGGLSRDCPVVIVESATLDESAVRPTTLGALETAAATRGSGPALLMLGEVFRGAAAFGRARGARGLR